MTGTERPRVTLKLATSLDGMIALGNGASKWITGPESRAVVHRMRAAHDAILTGIGTVLADNPQLTARPEGGCERQPDVIIMDSTGRTPGDAAVFKGGDRSVTLIPHRDLARAITGHERVMVEAGGKIAAAMIKANLVDCIEWFRAPIVLGGDGLPVMAALGLETLDEAPIFRRTGVVERGADLQETYERIR
ncbi:RibD family protein [Maricaulis maris]|uniref:Diaminohydroxyphosphoribosylaminopyrimidine deaminase/5-amino-6-(5-phosphoribosylamino)uracil reductase n=1 Tax=Maricaulis maris TaxID=74318 RepID=A0A495DMC3_9PROT|nr:RibD family protein [Maricaulis maris]RKR02886.1 diaminohydroxyphosphoribosylaminopyrimidine deaminase/5-amino-6-(5-phosphoribosylamino)uracil reductase [Maricaulis maris]